MSGPALVSWLAGAKGSTRQTGRLLCHPGSLHPVPGPRSCASSQGLSGRTQAWEFSTIPSQQAWQSRPPRTVSFSSPTTCPANCPVNKFATCRSCSLCFLTTASSPFFALLMSPTGRGNFLHLVVLRRELYCRRGYRCRLFSIITNPAAEVLPSEFDRRLIA